MRDPVHERTVTDIELEYVIIVETVELGDSKGHGKLNLPEIIEPLPLSVWLEF